MIVMDSTHKTNGMGWLLYNLMVRNEEGMWIPGAHMLTMREDSDVVAAGLRIVGSISLYFTNIAVGKPGNMSSSTMKLYVDADMFPGFLSSLIFEHLLTVLQIKRWCGNRLHLRYMLTDDSAGEQCAVRKAFRGLIDGECEVTHLLCKIHSRRTLMKKLPGKPNKKAVDHVFAALYNRRTKAGCEESVQAAITSCPTEVGKRYLENEWLKTMPDWANYTRCHSTLLLQVPSTNVVESWHNALKHGVKAAMANWSLVGLVQHIANISHQYDLRATKKRLEFRTRHLSDTAFYPGMRKLPYPVQLLII